MCAGGWFSATTSGRRRVWLALLSVSCSSDRLPHDNGCGPASICTGSRPLPRIKPRPIRPTPDRLRNFERHTVPTLPRGRTATPGVLAPFSTYAPICGDIFISWGPRFSLYGDTVNLSHCSYCLAIFTLWVNAQGARRSPCPSFLTSSDFALTDRRAEA